MAQPFVWLSSHQRYVVLAFVLFAFLVYFQALPYLPSFHGPGSRTKGYGNQGQGMDHLPEDLNYRLQDVEAVLSAHERPTQKSIFTKEMFTDTSTFSSEGELKPLSAIILKKSTQAHTLKQLVEQLLDYPFFREIIIYNTDSVRPLQKGALALDTSGNIKVHIVNAPKNERLDSLSRHTLCASMASNEHCYFQDDVYDDVDGTPVLIKNTYLDTLYLNFLRYPSLIHANVQSSRFIDHYRWRFHNQEIKMHAGYSDLAFGAIVPRWKAQNFLTQLSKSGLGKERLYEADAYFSIWSNQYPWLLDNPLSDMNGIAVSTRYGSDDIHQRNPIMSPNAQEGDTRRMIYDAARRLHRALHSDLSLNPKDYMDRAEEMPPVHQRDTRASCATDRCLLFTNIDPIPSHQIDMIPAFDKTKYSNPNDWDRVLDEHLILPKSTDWTQEGYHNAVDQRNDTCWSMKSNPRKDDYFGMIILDTTAPSQFVITTDTRLALASVRLDQLFKIQILRNKNDWEACKIVRHSTSTNDMSSNLNHNQLIDIHFDLDCSADILISNNKSHRKNVLHALRAVFSDDWETAFSVCELVVK